MGASVENIRASTNRTFIVWAKTDRGVMISRDGGLSWRAAPESIHVEFPAPTFQEWQAVSRTLSVRVNDAGALVKTLDGGQTAVPCMQGGGFRARIQCSSRPGVSWRVVRAVVTSAQTPSAGPKCGSGARMRPAPPISCTYWMGRYYGFIGKKD